MCYITTPYYTLCKCYGKQTISGKPCIRALTSAGCSRGCWDSVDLGIETVNARCPMCERQLLQPLSGLGEPLSRTSSAMSSGTSTPDVWPHDPLRKVNSGISLSSMASSISDTSGTSASSSKRAQSDRTALADLERRAFSVLLFPVDDAATMRGKTTEMPNLHWRTFGGSAASVRFKRAAE